MFVISRLCVIKLSTLLVILCSFVSFRATADAEVESYPIDKYEYTDKLRGFWLGLSIANWTGLITEMDKVKAPFYTEKDWGKPDSVNIWGNYTPHSKVIDFYFVDDNEPWGSDDDSDMEYMYQFLLEQNLITKLKKLTKPQSIMLTSKQISDGWIKHIYSNEDAPTYKETGKKENFLWVSNERARELMLKGVLPPETSEPKLNMHFNMIDAQLTTEIFGLFAPHNPNLALELAELPIRTTANHQAADISRFYVIMHSLAANIDVSKPLASQVFTNAQRARSYLPNDEFPAKMYDFVWNEYQISLKDKSLTWEQARDKVYERYQVNNNDGYNYHGGFDAGINFAASLVSLFYGEGDMQHTLKIGTLAGWDSDNPTATWGGLYGFILGHKSVLKVFNKKHVSDFYWIHRTRRNFIDRTPTESGEDTFQLMAERGVIIVDELKNNN